MVERKIIVKAPARLHLGLVKSSVDSGFIAAGLSLASPCMEVSVQLAPMGTKPQMSKAERSAASIIAKLGHKRAVVVETIKELPAHHGLGSGTRMALAAASGALRLVGEQMEILKITKLTGRGVRSAMGAVLFGQGGVAVDLEGDILRSAAPAAWRVALILPRSDGEGHGFHGSHESSRIDSAAACSATMRSKLAQAGVEGLMAGAAYGDFEIFQRAVALFQAQAARQFGPMQGGSASSPQGRKTLAWLKKEGIKACGQSSWGPALFALTPTPDEAKALVEKLKEMPHISWARVVKIDNRGARIKD